MLKYIFFFFLCCSALGLKAQYTLFGRSGSITYDKTMYMKNIVSKKFIAKADNNSKVFFEQILPKLPENAVLKKTLKFNGQETLFEPIKNDQLDEMVKQYIMIFALDFDATTLSNLSDRSFLRYNDIVGEKIIVEDTMKRIKWKITDEYREIAGYNCRRANGITPDSVYVIGYYCNEIPISGGPESINGLPGMILGLVVPSQHVSYFATKVELSNAVTMDKKKFDNSKVKRMTRKAMTDQLTSVLSQHMNKETVQFIMELGNL
ncbi:GLPGLI family protein [Sphingobacterium thalpophilum]|uniref:GLPGLI family protein n=1 Tax=Sphingobacterium thalpophilum TaxID=259 RepID=A0A4U9UN43_9SPHI|nr:MULTISPECIES: GLPGLI family protein [Sphingobacterium]MCW8310649.1 GLPGLI family protein [Sphingobacterium sp. InxBP1]VTR30921.1 GLPGLI family protein [Sphingobacterium thalpophilum]